MKFYHVEETNCFTSYEMYNNTVREEVIEYKGLNILVVQKINKISNRDFKFVLVPGVVRKQTVENGVKISEVDPISREDRQDLENLLRKQGYLGPINFS